jgi:hypothetical protein
MRPAPIPLENGHVLLVLPSSRFFPSVRISFLLWYQVHTVPTTHDRYYRWNETLPHVLRLM